MDSSSWIFSDYMLKSYRDEEVMMPWKLMMKVGRRSFTFPIETENTPRVNNHVSECIVLSYNQLWQWSAFHTQYIILTPTVLLTNAILIRWQNKPTRAIHAFRKTFNFSVLTFWSFATLSCSAANSFSLNSSTSPNASAAAWVRIQNYVKINSEISVIQECHTSQLQNI